jgi:hypothetical protein
MAGKCTSPFKYFDGLYPVAQPCSSSTAKVASSEYSQGALRIMIGRLYREMPRSIWRRLERA